ncbi:MFS transporter [Pseudenhygromyxa sp. WMMC2535]|uniref:MFS transporter n=1 Tax=Pseudenhygromyxa sp. WMMC2535 TaxID=2712867 RepID=UPI001552BD8D|nr:MFS transporter [Pseudenhygromyxa sp. WMMC2535]NVB37655.1 MFS transporter [Pseudenhygromyxa sp. WMMC2535]
MASDDGPRASEADEIGSEGDTRQRLSTFVAASCSLVLVFAVAGTPIPLFNVYRVDNGVTNAELGVVSVAYFIAAAVALLVLGRLSNHLGRKPVALAALACAGLSCVLMIAMRGPGLLLVGRLLQGLGCGLASSALGAYVVDNAPERPRWLPALVTGSSPMVGIAFGAMSCGALVDYGPAPRVLIYALMGALVLTCVVLIARSPETMARRPGALASLRPAVQWPEGSGRALIAVGAVFVGTWAMGGFFQAFGPSIVVERLGSDSALVAAAVFASVMVLNPIGGPMLRRLSPAWAVRVGMTIFVFALIFVIVSLREGALAPLIAASLCVGLAQGASSTGGLRALLPTAAPSERAGLLAAVYLIAYGGTAIPGLLAAQLVRTQGLFTIALGYASIGMVATLVALIAAHNPERTIQPLQEAR